MDNYEAIGVLKTLSDLNGSSYIKEAVELSIKSLKAAVSEQTAHKLLDELHNMILRGSGNYANMYKTFSLCERVNDFLAQQHP